MTKEERDTRNYLAEKLGEQGYATYAKLFMLFELRLTSDPRFVGYMEPSKGRITLNRTLAQHQMGLIIRHEILHEYLSHEIRLLDHLAEKNPDLAADEVTLKEILYGDDTFNVAADYEISNRGYTEQDKKDVRAIQLGGQIVSGLVTEDKHPDWVDLTVEEMYDLLKDEQEQAKQDAQQSQEGQTGGDQEQGDDDQGEQSGESQDDQNGEQGDQEGESEGQDEESDGQDGESGDQDSSSSGQENQDGEGERADDKEDSNGQEQQSGQQGNQQSQQQSGQSQSNQQGQGQRMRVIRGTMKDGKFYGLDGREIKPGG